MKIINYIKQLHFLHKAILSVSIFVLSYIYLAHSFSFNIIEPLFSSFYKPLFLALIPFIACLVVLVLTPNYFLRWVYTVASWYLPISILLLSMTDIHGGYTFWGRSELAWLLMWGLFIITVIFVVVIKIRQWRS